MMSSTSSLCTRLSLISSFVSAIFLLLFPWRLRQLNRDPVKVRRSRHHENVKLVSSIVFLCVQVIATYLTASSTETDNLVLTAVPPAAALGLAWLSRQEHRRAIRPSSLILLYVLSLLLLDVVKLTAPSSLRMLGSHDPFPTCVRLISESLVLWVECRSKDAVLVDQYQDGLSAEEKASVLGRAVFWWINPVLARGYKTVLTNNELPHTDSRLRSETLRVAILGARLRSSKFPDSTVDETLHTHGPESYLSLPLVLAECLLRPFLSVILPRLCLILVRYAQPVLISYVIQYVTSSDGGSEDEGYFIIVAAVFVYAGLAISTGVYRHGLDRLQVMVRGVLTSLLHEHTLLAQSRAYDDGSVVALVTNEVSALETTAEMFHEVWAQALEVIVGTVLLAGQVGWLWPVPHIIILVCSQVSRYVAQNMKTRQTEWNAATQGRLAVTASVLGNIKTIKMLGLQEKVAQHVHDLRQEEMKKARSVRWVMVIYNASANALGMFAPVITIVLFAAIAMHDGSVLDTKTAFPTIATLALVTHSANMVMTMVPKLVAAQAGFERIQGHIERIAPVVDLRSMGPPLQQPGGDAGPIMVVKNLTVTFTPFGKRILDGINLDLSPGKVVACSGPVGAGKTTLARAMLAEVTSCGGFVRLATHHTVAYCAQTPWLTGQTIKQLIRGPAHASDRDQEEWYNIVVKACCLEQDLAMLPGGDGTLVGGRGMNLSGGQRQRVALARAIYQRPAVAILDDVFSALDGATEGKVAENLFGPKGLFREMSTAVFWIANSTPHLHLADHVIILVDGKIEEQGSWSQLRSHEQEISKLIHHYDNDASAAPVTSHEDYPMVPKRAPLTEAPEKKDSNRGSGDFSLYTLYSFFITFPQYWVKWWTRDSEDGGRHTTFYIVGYALLNLMAWISTNGTMWSTVMQVAERSGLVLHGHLLATIMRAPLAYFSNTDTGVILNHFGQDIQLVDKQLASAVSTLGTQMFKLVMQASLLLAVQPWMSVTLPVCAAVVYIVQKVYLRTSRQLRLIELESRSAVYSSLLETVQGIETIRASKWEPFITAAFTESLGMSQRPLYLLLCLQRWLNVVLDLTVAGIAAGTIALSIYTRTATGGGNIGVALTVILVANTTLLRLVESWTNLEISLGAASRLRTVEEDTPFEEDNVSIIDWPTRGGLEIKDLCAAYNNDTPALNDVTLSVQPGQTVIICGRTGSGKSSLVLALLRLLPIHSGSISLSGLNISRIPLHILRGRCFYPFFLPSASLRFNLDPSNTLTDTDLITLLEEVADLWAHFTSSSMQIYPGQTQLLALARGVAQVRAVTRLGAGFRDGTSTGSNPIVLLDEITSSLDPEAEKVVYDTIQREFVDKGFTVVMVSHKLAAVTQYLKAGPGDGDGLVVVTMGDGRVESVQRLSEITTSNAATPSS
ncbi:P-loop containing nucleoside triphosphate hydrolase protein [Diplogelasinospora grovesii]|uniref:P-loop containing nucleoside triphosphate hydrolase protein n=1 Tax=Diplogelasinospora grovesii TaxID=303347 RepID=A0AAN6NAL4_9PEZI|nr:P-loop containing nucleoside triphosphate hydrolase protein [Diplogelasinospora grovesii]